MESIGELWRKHPYAVAGGIFVLGAILIYYFLRGGSAGASDQSAYYGAQAAVAVSGNQLAGLQTSLQAHATDVAAQLAAFQTDKAAQVAVEQSKIAATVHVADTTSRHDLDIAGIQADTIKYSNNLTAQIAGEDLAGKLALGEYSLTAALENARIQTNAATISHQIDTTGAVDLARIQTMGNIEAAHTDATRAVNLANVSAYRDITLAGYSRDVNLAGLQDSLTAAGYVRDVNLTGLAADVSKTQIAADVANTTSYRNFYTTAAQQNYDYTLKSLAEYTDLAKVNYNYTLGLPS